MTRSSFHLFLTLSLSFFLVSFASAQTTPPPAQPVAPDAPTMPPADKTSPVPVLSIKHEAGWGGGTLATFRINPDGAFVLWLRPEPPKLDVRLITGTFPPAEIQSLVRKVAEALPGPEAEDAGTVTFRWTDNEGKIHSRVYTSPRESPCAELLTTIYRASAQFSLSINARIVQRDAWIAKCLADFQTIKPGMTRGEIEKRFGHDGGLQSTVSPIRFTHSDCFFFKIDVEFDFKRNPDDQNRPIASLDDKATKVSKPYIESPTLD